MPLIAETGGQNAIIIDSSALPEQVIDDVIASAFRSAGQRCSAARILCLPHATADSMIAALASGDEGTGHRRSRGPQDRYRPADRS
ncbi:MAG: aldehyde dehydrogenase family protein [Alphaproteobacteria bacterium]